MTEYKTASDIVEQSDGIFCRVQLSAPDGTGCVFMIPLDARTMKRFRDDIDLEATDEASEIVDGPKAEAFARALDTLGWMIVRQSYYPGEAASKWPMDGSYSPVPKWAEGSLRWRIDGDSIVSLH